MKAKDAFELGLNPRDASKPAVEKSAASASRSIDGSIEKSASRKDASKSPARRGALHCLTDAEARRLGNGNHSDGGGLILQVKGASRRWYYRYTRDAKTFYVSIGGYPDRKLKDAREKAAECRNLIADAIDPKVEWERRAAAEREVQQAAHIHEQREAATLEVIARAYHAAHLSEWTRKHGAQWMRQIELHILPKLGARPIADIKPAELLDLLLPLRTAMPETGTRIRERLDVIYADAILRGLTEQNPAAAIAKAMRGKRGERKRRRKHHAAMDYAAVPAFIETLHTSDRLGVSVALAFEFMILAAARTAEVLGATWAEIDEQRRTWTIAAERMKARQPHTVYLTDRALAILRQARTLGSDYLFPSPQRASRPLSNMAFLTALERLGLWGSDVDEAQRVTAHGFRASFSTWANEQHFPRDVIEAALAHGESNAVRAAYNRAEYVEQRKRLAEAWAAFCEGDKPKRLRVIAGAR